MQSNRASFRVQLSTASQTSLQHTDIGKVVLDKFKELTQEFGNVEKDLMKKLFQFL